MSPSLNSSPQARFPYPELPRDVPHLWPPPVVRPVSTPSHTFPSSPLWRSHSSGDLQRSNYQELTPTTPMGALLPISQLHHVSERYSFLPQFLFRSSIAKINILPYILPYIGAGAHERAQQCAVDTQTNYKKWQGSLFIAWAAITSLPHAHITLVPSPVNSCTYTAPLPRNHPHRAFPMF